MPATLAKFGKMAKAMLISEIQRKLERGQRGLLGAGRGREYDVDKMECVSDVLELRLTAQLDGEGKKLHTRIYFNEPELHPGELRLLVIETKIPDEPGLQEQNEHARRAQGRLDTCSFEAAGMQS